MNAGEPMITRSDIMVDENDVWLFDGKPVENEEILAYFKLNLKREGEEYYILNQFGPLKEHAYLSRVEGFPLKAILLQWRERDSLLELTLDSRETITVPPSSLRIYDESTLGVEDQKGGIPIRLSSSAMSALSEYLGGGEEGYHLSRSQGERIPLPHSSRSSLFASSSRR